MNKTPKSTKTQFKPGQSGNPLGRPKRLPSLDRIVAEVLTATDKKNVTVIQRIIMKLAQRALRGDRQSAELLLDRAYGRLSQRIGITAGNEIEIFLKMSPEDKANHIKSLESNGE